MDLSSLDCVSLTTVAGPEVRVTKLDGWADGIRVYEVPNVIYIPNHRVPICIGIVPEEAVNYPFHFDINRKSFGGYRAEPDQLERSSVDVCILGNVFSHVFGHWMEELLKVVVLEKCGFAGHYLIPEGYPAFCRDSFEFLGVAPERLHEATDARIYDRGFFTSVIHHFNAHRHPKLIRHLRDLLHELGGDGDGGGSRIWVDRGQHALKGRDIVNREEVAAYLGQHGFRCVDLGQLRFREQILIDRQMQVMLVPHGSAAVHCGFMANRSTVIELFSPLHLNPSIIQLCLALEHRYHQIVPVNTHFHPYQHGNEILVDLDQLQLVLSRLDSR